MFAIVRRTLFILAFVESTSVRGHDDVAILECRPLTALVHPGEPLQPEQLVAIVHPLRVGGRVGMGEAGRDQALVDA